MASIRLMHWNIEQLGDKKFNNGNKIPLMTYIADLIKNEDADIVVILEVKDFQSPMIAHLLIGLLGENQWGGVKVSTQFNNEQYMMFYRTDRNFKPIAYLNGAVVDSPYPESTLTNVDTSGKVIPFQRATGPRGGRVPFYATFRTTDTNKKFSVIGYHAMFNPGQTQIGVRNIAKLAIITQFNDAVPVPIDASLICGDFNLDYNDNNIDYNNLLAFSSNAVIEKTTLVNNTDGKSTDPSTYRVNAYDNIFQRPAQPAPPPPAIQRGQVIDLMVKSAIINYNPPLNPPNMVNGVGYLAKAASAFDVTIINAKLKYLNPAYAIVKLPPVEVATAWDFVREVISDHYPVAVTTVI